MSIERQGPGAEDQDFHPEAEINPEQSHNAFMAREQSVLEKFRGKARDVAKVMMFVSGLAAGEGMVSEAHAEQPRQGQKVEKAERRNLTENSKWSDEIATEARRDLKDVQTAQDAEGLVANHFNHFVSEFYLPTKGDVVEAAYGVKTREYSKDDASEVLDNARIMKSILEQLHAKFILAGYENRLSQINDVIIKIERKTTVAGQSEQQILKRAQEIIPE
jgi:hypothetical protein